MNRLAVIKTGWCETYNGEDVQGNFAHLIEGGSGAERYNMRAANGHYEVYALPKGDTAPTPEPTEGWMIVHVARDPAEANMKIVGWYENASFVGSYLERDQSDGTDRSIYCIRAQVAFELLPADRPIIDHGGRFGSSGIFWLRGNTNRSGRSWSKIAARIDNLVAANRNRALPGKELDGQNGQRLRGDTTHPAKQIDGIDVDDGGTAFGRSSIAESAEHKALRLWACANPSFFAGKKKVRESQTEWRLPSGDEVDVMHSDKDTVWLIEAKSRRSGEADLERGVYQCVKYRAVAEAMQKGARKRSDILSVLLTEAELSDRLSELARRQRVRVICYRMEG